MTLDECAEELVELARADYDVSKHRVEGTIIKFLKPFPNFSKAAARSDLLAAFNESAQCSEKSEAIRDLISPPV